MLNGEFSAMNDIQSLEAAVGADPSNTAARLAWADALDNSGKPLRAAYQRLIAEFHARPKGELRSGEAIGQFMSTADALGQKELSRYMFQASVFHATWGEMDELGDSRSSVAHLQAALQRICAEAGEYVSQAAVPLVYPFTPARMERLQSCRDVWSVPVVDIPPFTVVMSHGLPIEISCSWWTWQRHSESIFKHLPIESVRLADRPALRFAYGQWLDRSEHGTLYLDLPRSFPRSEGVPCRYSDYRSWAFSRSGSPTEFPNKYTTPLLKKQWPLIRTWYYPRIQKNSEDDPE